MLHGLPYLVNCSILFTELPLLDRPAAAKRVGFDAVEFWWPFDTGAPAVDEVDAFVAAIHNAGVALAGLNFAAGDMPGGDRGLASWPGRESEFRASVEVAVRIAERLGTGVFNALYGNRLDGVDPHEQDDLAVANLEVAARAAAEVGARVLLEPVSGAARYPLLTAREVLDVIERVRASGGVENLRLLADLYHLSVNGDDLDAVVREHAAQVGHVQIADAPGRHEPGTGTLDLDRHLSALEATGYDGWVGLEYSPSTTSQDSFDWLPRERRSASSAGAA